MSINLVYLASPYNKFSGGKEMAYQLACNKASQLMLQGYKVFCPIAHSHSIEVESGMPIQDGEWWLQQDFAVLYWCSKLFVYKMPGWDTSHGVQREIDFADQYGIPIEYLEYNEVDYGQGRTATSTTEA